MLLIPPRRLTATTIVVAVATIVAAVAAAVTGVAHARVCGTTPARIGCNGRTVVDDATTTNATVVAQIGATVLHHNHGGRHHHQHPYRRHHNIRRVCRRRRRNPITRSAELLLGRRCTAPALPREGELAVDVVLPSACTIVQALCP